MGGNPGAGNEKVRRHAVGLLGSMLTQPGLEAGWVQAVCDRHQRHPYRIPRGPSCVLSILVFLVGA